MGKSGAERGAKPSLDRQQPVKISSSQLASFGKSLDWSLNHADLRLKDFTNLNINITKAFGNH